MPAKHVLIIDDEPDICELIEITLTRMGLKTQSAQNLNDARILLETEVFDLCLTDMRLPDGSGIELVKHVQKNYPKLPIAVITAHGNMESAVKALKAGAFDFVSKPVDIQLLRSLVSAATTLPEKDADKSNTKTTITGDSLVVKSLLDQIGKLARSHAPVFIQGESGSGKERAARMIHEQGARSAAPFVPINCGAIPAELMESEFFGHVKGSFTGASSDKQGLFQAANGGTLFLDEVAELPLHMQVKLLRSIQEKAVRPIGAQHEHPVDVRILSASHKNLVDLIQEGLFRKDLYYRINVIELNVPRLSDRPEDIPALAKQIIQSLTDKSELKKAPRLDKSALAALMDYPFPGNVRELENILERALAMAESDTISQNCLHLDKASYTKGSENTETLVTAGTRPVETGLAETERQAIVQALEKTRWNKTAAAKLLGLSLRQLRYRLEKFEIE